MKRLLPLLLLPLLWSCNNDTREIKRVAFGYLDAMGNYRIADAEPFATDETIETSLYFVQHVVMAQVDTNSDLAAYIASNTPATIEITRVERTSDTSAVASFTKTTPIQTQHGEKTLLKRNGQWRVHEVIQLPDMLRAATADTIVPPTADTDSLRVQKASR